MVDGYVTLRRAKNVPGLGKVLPDGSSPSGYDRFRFQTPAGLVTPSNSEGFPSIRQVTDTFRSSVTVPPSITGKELKRLLMSDYSHRFAFPFDSGHTFDTTLEQCTYTNSSPLGGGSKFKYIFNVGSKTVFLDGPLVAYSGGLPPEPPFDFNWYANRVLKDAAPTSPRANLAQGLAEFAREFLPRLPGMLSVDAWQKGTDRARAAGSEYLNVNFGWVPLVSEILASIESLVNASRFISQLERDSGKIVRRRVSLPMKIEKGVNSITTDHNNLYYPGSSGLPSDSNFNQLYWGGSRNAAFTNSKSLWTTKQQVWFSGAFTYYLKTDKNRLGRLGEFEERANYLLGTRITPSVLWELSPWSWLADWIVDIGSALQTAELFADQGLLMRYGYLMRQTTREVRNSTRFRTSDGVLHYFTTTRRVVRKQRFRATPFGFGLNPNSFTEAQWAILAALGLSKAPKGLW